MKRILQWTGAGMAVVVMIAAIVGAYRLHDGDDESSEGRNKQTQKLESSGGGGPLVHLDKDSEAISGIRTAALQQTDGRTETQVVAVVLSPQELLDLRNSYMMAVAQVEKARASENASQLEFQRLSQLNKEDQNASDKAVQASEAAYRSDTATLHNAEQALTLAALSAEQRWGPVVSKWITSDAPPLRDVLEGRSLLLQVTSPPGTTTTQHLLLQAGQQTADARLISALPRVDPRFQTLSSLYIARAERELAPGMNVVAYVSRGSQQSGVLLPRNAVLSWQGKSWVYVETEAGTFTRTEVSLDAPVRNGWFIRNGLRPGERVVITGAQQLLSQEFRSQAQQEDND